MKKKAKYILNQWEKNTEYYNLKTEVLFKSIPLKPHLEATLEEGNSGCTILVDY